MECRWSFHSLLDQKSVAVYHGLAEAGPRALGNRSILFDCRNKDAKSIINKIKNREWYRPFAAIVLEEDSYLFDMIGVDIFDQIIILLIQSETPLKLIH